jgi:uncharacterized membrane protein YphA (DoxX/SURF4 family)
MFSLWPELFAYELVAVAVLRIVVGYLLLSLGVRLWSAVHGMRDKGGAKRTVGFGYAVLQVVTGMLLIVGAYTQGAALGATLLILISWVSHRTERKCEQHLHLLLLVTSLALVFLGPGAFAIDLPL